MLRIKGIELLCSSVNLSVHTPLYSYRPDRDGGLQAPQRPPPWVPLFLGTAQFSISFDFVLIDSMYFLYTRHGNLYLPTTFTPPVCSFTLYMVLFAHTHFSHA